MKNIIQKIKDDYENWFKVHVDVKIENNSYD